MCPGCVCTADISPWCWRLLSVNISHAMSSAGVMSEGDFRDRFHFQQVQGTSLLLPSKPDKFSRNITIWSVLFDVRKYVSFFVML